MSVVSHMTQTIIVGAPERKLNPRNEWEYGSVTTRGIVPGCSVQPGLMDGLEGSYQGDGKVAYTVWAPAGTSVFRWDLVVVLTADVVVRYKGVYDGIWADESVPKYRVDAHPQVWDSGTILDHTCLFLVGAD